MPIAADPEVQPKWHVEKEVPLALIVSVFLAIAAQTATGIWWSSAMSVRVGLLETRADSTETRVTKAAEGMGPVDTRLSRVETKVEYIQADISEIKMDVKALVKR